MSESTGDPNWDHFYNLGKHALEIGDYPEAESLWFACMQVVEFLGEEDPRLAMTLDNLAEACYCQNKMSQAKSLFAESLGLKERVMGKGHFDLTFNLKRLAAIHYHDAELNDAAELGQRVLQLYEKHLGPEHPETLEICMNLAILFHRLKQLDQAKVYYDRAMVGKDPDAPPTKAVSKPFDDRPLRPTSTCEICGKQYAGISCLKCTYTEVEVFDLSKYAGAKETAEN
jgi:tetratricopeptide (TPR) repeat protein